MRYVVVVVVAGSLVGCVESKSRLCGDLVCSETAVCSPAGDRCVAQSAIDACGSSADGAGCNYPGVPEGVCVAGVCSGAGCGNGLVDPNSEEQCDDGNRISLDGCSADCRSDERCGDGVADLAVGELCDCGDGTTSVPGCTMANANVSGASCRADCRPARCGDDVLDPNETCDDGNTTPGDGCRADCTGRWTVMATGTFADLFDVWGTGPNDVWAVGARKLLHFDGTSWSAATPPSPAPGVYEAVWGTAANDVYALSTARLDRWNGSQWSVFLDLDDGDSNTIARHLWGTAGTNLWIGLQDVGSSSGYVRHYTGTLGAAEQLSEIQQMTGTSSRVFVSLDSGVNDDRYRLIYNAGGGWLPLTGTSSTMISDAIVARFVLPFADNNIFAYDPFSLTGPKMRRYDGSTWTATPCCEEMGGSTLDFGGVAGDYLMVGYQGRISTSVDGFNWVISPSESTRTLNAVWSAAPNRAFAVGEAGTILY